MSHESKKVVFSLPPDKSTFVFVVLGHNIVAYDDQGGGGFAPRPMVQGNWACSDCGTAITELPFAPSGDRPVYCRDCFRKHRPPRRNFRR